ncbi:MAG: hypothetical protein ACOYM2_13590 [Rectinemataceae bacterium]
MKSISILGTSYDLPEIRDARFESLQEGIKERRELLQKPSDDRRFPMIFKKKVPPLDANHRIGLMEELVGNYDELVTSLKEKIGSCKETFGCIGDGVREYFTKKAAELEVMEKRRAELIAEAHASGQEEVAQGLEGECQRIRALVYNLTRSSVLIIRKLRHALTALETLVDDEAAQRRVLDSLRTSVSIFRKTHQFMRDLDAIEDDIATMTRLALNFDSILRDNLGPLSILIDEVSKVDARVADSLMEIEKLSAQLEAKKDVSGIPGRFDDRIFDLLVRAQTKRDALDGIVAAMSDPNADLGEIGFAVDLVGSGDLDFKALTMNMGELVRRGLADLRSDVPLPLIASEGTIPDWLTIDNEAVAETEVKAEVLAEAISTESAPATTNQDAIVQPKEEVAPAWAQAAAQATTAARRSSAGQAQRSAYTRAISRADPTLIVFLLDRSGSMGDNYARGLTKAEFLARTVDKTLMELAVRCNKADGTRDYFHIACIGYNDGKIGSAFSSPLDGEDWLPISRVAASPIGLVKGIDGSQIPNWVRTVSDGDTPMKAAFEHSCRLVARWCDGHPRSYPPTIINVSDGQSTDGDPSGTASILRQLHTEDGECLVYNLHVSSAGGIESVFPDSAAGLDEHGKLLYSMSSQFPPHLVERAQALRMPVNPASRFFAYGAGTEVVTSFFDLGTRTTRLA